MAKHVGATATRRRGKTEYKLQQQVWAELGQAVKFIGRAANLLRHEDSKDDASIFEATKALEALEQVTANVTEHVDNMLAKR